MGGLVGGTLRLFTPVTLAQGSLRTIVQGISVQGF